MKFTLAAATLGFAAAAAPAIELNLEGMSNAFKLKKSIYRAHDLKYLQPGSYRGPSKTVGSRQDWTEKCAAKLGCQTRGTAAYTSCLKACPYPVARAYDHADGTSVSVVTRIFLVDEEGQTLNKAVADVNFGKRSTYLFKYDAKDQAGNRAEQVVFALILDDQTAPTINVCNGVAESVEAASTWKLCSSTVAFDNIDGNLNKALKYSVTQVTGDKSLVRNTDWAGAAKRITTNEVGKFLVTYTVADKAGVYGRGSKNNRAYARKAILVKDTRKPWVRVHGAAPVYFQCTRYAQAADKYIDQGASASDLLDTVALGKTIKIAQTGSVSEDKVGTYKFTYNAQDNAGNKAAPKSRMVYVRDTLKPTLKLNGAKHVIFKHSAANKGKSVPENGASVQDACEPAFAKTSPLFQVKPSTCSGIVRNKASCSVAWNRAFHMKKLGTYTRTYTVQDSKNNKAHAVRTFELIDEAEPMITIMGDTVETYEASRDIEYTDKGATCEDHVDGVLSHAVEVSGQVVNMRIPGTYKIRYDCQDLSGNQAKFDVRTIVVQDTLCPTLKIKGAMINYVEAGFDFVDAGATATDSLDGDITGLITTDGDTVDTGAAFYAKTSCNQIKNQCAQNKQKCTSGPYFITSKAAMAYKRNQVWCDMDSKFAGTYMFAMKKTAQKLTQKSAFCESNGLKIYNYLGQQKTRTFTDLAQHVTKTLGGNLAMYGLDLTQTNQKTDTYVCVSKKMAAGGTALLTSKDAQRAANAVATSSTISNSEVGKYVVAYHVADKAGNKECNTKFRTVIVSDTLAPVIALHYKGTLIQRGVASKGSKKNGERVNLAGISQRTVNGKVVGNPFLKNLMAEQTEASPVNAWIVGAAASAVTGLALLGYSQRKSTVTTVPV